MENKVGDNLPTDVEIATRIAQLDDIIAWLQTFCLNLSPEQRAVLTRGRLGAEPHLLQVAETAKEYGWSAPGVTPDQVINDLRLVQALAPIRHKLALAHGLADDTISQGSSEANEGGYMFYGMAQSLGSRIPAIEASVRPFAEFLSNTRKKGTKKDDGSSTGSP